MKALRLILALALVCAAVWSAVSVSEAAVAPVSTIAGPGSMFHAYPISGVTKWWSEPSWGPHYVFYRPSGSGVVTDIVIQENTADNWVGQKWFALSVWTGLGNLGEDPALGFSHGAPGAIIPYWIAGGSVDSVGLTTTNAVDTAGNVAGFGPRETTWLGLNHAANDSARGVLFRFSLPIPYHNGVFIAESDSAGNIRGHTYSNAIAVEGSVNPNWFARNYKLRSREVRDPSVAKDEVVTWLNTSKAGILAGLFVGYSSATAAGEYRNVGDSAILLTLDGTPVIGSDPNAPCVLQSLFGFPLEWNPSRTFNAPTRGCWYTSNDGNDAMDFEGYWIPSGSPGGFVTWKKSAVGTFKHENTGTTASMWWCALYYGP